MSEPSVYISDQDLMFLQMMQNAIFDEKSLVTLPSGLTVTGKQLMNFYRKVNDA